MADQQPKHRFRLPQDVETLSRMRDDLGDYLATLERNTDAVDAWLAANTEKITVSHHQLVRAITSGKDDAAATALLSGMGDVAGFVLGLQDFTALAETHLGKDSAFAKAAAGIQKGIPDSILQPLPEVKLPEDKEDAGKQALPVPAPTPLPDKEKGWWSSVGSWFSKDDSRDREAEQKKQEEELAAIRRRWRQVQTELVALQSDRHYYIDSFMDWIGESLAPEDPAADVSKVMESYQNPEYVISLAQEDYGLVVGAKANAVREKALEYSLLAGLVDKQDIAQFIKVLPALFPARETHESERTKRLLLRDFGVQSFAELALGRVKNRASQFELYAEALSLEKGVPTTKPGRAAFDAILDEVLDRNDPLDPRALSLTLRKLRSHAQKGPADVIDIDRQNPFAAIAARFAGSAEACRQALDMLLQGLGIPADAGKVVNFRAFVDQKDSGKLAALIDAIGASGRASEFKGLWLLCYPQSSLFQDILSVAATAQEKGMLVSKALDAGLADDLQAPGRSHLSSANNAKKFFEKHVLPAMETFPVTAARKILATAYAAGGLDGLRGELTGRHGWINRVMTSAMNEAKKLEWVAAFIEPYASDITRANILEESAKNATPAVARELSLLERNLVGENLRLGDDRMMLNLDRIANIWYHPKDKLLKYTVTGIANVFATDVEQHEAAEILALLKRRGGFESEYSGIFRPELIDKYYTHNGKTRICWHRKNDGDLHADTKTVGDIHARPDFLHEKCANGATYSVNGASIALIQKLKDGTHLLVDKYGIAEILEGAVTLPASGTFVTLGGAMFNPDCASIISLNRAEGCLEFRVESADFDDFLNKAAPDDYFYAVKVPDEEHFRKIEKTIAACPAIATPGGAISKLHFNFKAIGYLTYDDSRVVGGKRDTGFLCKKYSPTKRPGFIRAQLPLADDILRGFAANPDVVMAGNTVTHKSVIDNAYYDMTKKWLYFFIGNEYRYTPCAEKDGVGVLKKLAKEPGFSVVGSNFVGRQMEEIPADIVRFTRATMLKYAPAAEKVAATSDYDSYPINLDRAQADELFDALAEKGLKKARDASASLPWTQKLGTVLDDFQSVMVRVPPALETSDRQYLLGLLSSQGKTDAPALSVSRHFATAAADTLRVNDSFVYPAARKQERKKQAGQKPRR